MKSILALLAAVTVFGIAAPSTSQAGDYCHPGSRRVVSYLSCGTPVYATWQICGYDRYGNPQGHWVTDTPRYCPPPRPVCPPPSYCPPSYGHGHSRAHFPIPRGGSFSVYFGR